jgi:hypothetical protein
MCGTWKQYSSALVGLAAMQSSRDMQLDPEISLSRLYDTATTEAWRDMAMISGVMTRTVRLIAHQIQQLRVV